MGHDPLYFTTKRLLSDPRIVLPTRIVVIGANRCAYSVLETLCFIPYLHLVNIFFVADGSPPSWKKCAQAGSQMNSHERKPPESGNGNHLVSLCPCDEDESFEHEIDSLGLSGRVTLVNGRLTDIDRKNKVVVISDSIPLEYDVMVITAPSEDSTFRKFENTANIHPRHLQERGIFGLGSSSSDDALSQWLFGPRGPRTPGVVIYGSGLVAWSVAGRLLGMGLEPERIVWILPRGEFMDGEMGHETIDELAQKSLLSSGVKMLVGFKIKDLNFSESKCIYSVNVSCMPGAPSFEKYEERKRRDRERAERKAKLAAERNEEFWNVEELKDETSSYDEVVMCGTLILCENFHVDIDVFSAINDSGLVYDGGIVVDSNFCTVDPYIFAAGDCTRFSRQHGVQVVKHNSINSRELGTYVAVKVIEQHLDPQLDGEVIKNQSMEPMSVSAANGTMSHSSSLKRNSLPVFSLPRTTSIVLPGGYQFLQSRLPDVGKHEILSMVTGGPEMNRICVVKTNSLGLVVEISYIGKEIVEGRNIGRLVGWHESFLSNACFSYESGQISDWIEFFREPWCSFIYHDNFTAFAGGVKEFLQEDKGMFTVQDKLVGLASKCRDDGILSLERRKMLGNRGENVPEIAKKAIESHTLEFLRKNKSSFARIFIPPHGGTKVVVAANEAAAKRQAALDAQLEASTNAANMLSSKK